MMQDYYLKTADEQSLWEALESAGLAKKEYDREDPLNVPPEDLEMDAEWSPTGAYEWVFTGIALDVIGPIYTPTGNMLTDDEGIEYPEMVAVDGYHANLIADEGIEGLPEITAPDTPYRQWAGR